MFFCDDVDLMVWEPGVFGEAAFAHQELVHQAAGTLTGTSLTMSAAVLGGILPGMVGQVVLADGSLSQLLEVVSVPDASHATVSGLRARSGDTTVLPLFGGSVKVTVMTFRAQIAAVGDELLGLVGAASDRDMEVTARIEALSGFRVASVFGTLAAVLRTISTGEGVTSAMLAKRDFYLKAYHEMRRRIAACVNGRKVAAGVEVLNRE